MLERGDIGRALQAYFSMADAMDTLRIALTVCSSEDAAKMAALRTAEAATLLWREQGPSADAPPRGGDRDHLVDVVSRVVASRPSFAREVAAGLRASGGGAAQLLKSVELLAHFAPASVVAQEYRRVRMRFSIGVGGNPSWQAAHEQVQQLNSIVTHDGPTLIAALANVCAARSLARSEITHTPAPRSQPLLMDRTPSSGSGTEPGTPVTVEPPSPVLKLFMDLYVTPFVTIVRQPLSHEMQDGLFSMKSLLDSLDVLDEFTAASRAVLARWLRGTELRLLSEHLATQMLEPLAKDVEFCVATRVEKLFQAAEEPESSAEVGGHTFGLHTLGRLNACGILRRACYKAILDCTERHIARLISQVRASQAPLQCNLRSV